MSSFQIIIGSMLGGTEYVAEACQETLEALGHQVTLHYTPEFSAIAQKDQTWLICTSTHGAGDYPDNIQAFVNDLAQCEQDLIHTKYAVIGIGDTNYDTFCFAAKNIDKLLNSISCNKVLDVKTIDITAVDDPELAAQEWLEINKDRLS
ncbi:FMN-binding protein MioC [Thalassotalea euphylliae]|uniref:FMN-binding protein MioC n=1 Tax=Thalassotalea euphylliae TaxID=1655234 RepID=A0A3E0TVP2_9GAMM|nr:FMN-binding protein MioC [Thalassotalea euphylliae]REL28741.1 FMN-binding protein MioC [Thalassotalea euphylliae]